MNESILKQGRSFTDAYDMSPGEDSVIGSGAFFTPRLRHRRAAHSGVSDRSSPPSPSACFQVPMASCDERWNEAVRGVWWR